MAKVRDRLESGVPVTQKSAVIVVALGLVMLVAEVADAKFHPEPRTAQQQEIVSYWRLALASPLQTTRTTKPLGSRSADQDSVDSASIIDCLQLQAIDEVDLLGEIECVN